MANPSASTPDIQAFYNLAVFICHLFADGNFRTGQILYDPNMFNGHLISAIDSYCPHRIPWTFIDITQTPSELRTSPTNPVHILQLIFPNPDHLTKSIDNFKDDLLIHPVFVFFSNDQDVMEDRVKALSESGITPDIDSLVVYHLSKNDSIQVHWIPKYNAFPESEHFVGTFNDVSIFIKDHKSIFEDQNLFDLTFDKNERNWPMAVNTFIGIPCYEVKSGFLSKHFRGGTPYLANFFASSTNSGFINLFTAICNNVSKINLNLVRARPKSHKVYSELTLEYELVDGEELWGNFALLLTLVFVVSWLNEGFFVLVKFRESLLKMQPNELGFSPNERSSINSSKSRMYRLYPHGSLHLAIVFFYGSDVRREKDIEFIPEEVKGMAIFILSSWIVFATILYLIRRRASVRYGGFLSSLIDTCVPLMGGGVSHMTHRFERFFFGTLLLMVIVLSPLWSDVFLIQTYQVLDEKITSLRQLAVIDPPIYRTNVLPIDDQALLTMLRWYQSKFDQFEEITFAC